MESEARGVTKKEAAERKRNRTEMAERAPDPKATAEFRRKPYSGIKTLIRAQGEQIEKSGGVYEKDNLGNRVDHSEAVEEKGREV